MRIVFDGSTLRPGRTGVGYYTEHLLQQLVEAGSEHEWLVVSNEPVETTRALPSHVRVATAGWRLPRMVWMQTRAPWAIRRLGADVAHFTNGMMPLASPVPTVVTIHDMSLTLFPRYHPPRRVLLNRPLVNFAARRADAIITVSQSARDDIVRLYGVAPDRIHVVHEAAAPHFVRVTDQETLQRVRRRYRLAERFVLYVGTLEPRKNIRVLVEAHARRRRAGDLPHQLVCAGPSGWLCDDIEALLDRMSGGDAIRVTGYVPVEDLPAIYSLAEMLVFPSIYEGFGLPVIEAMACGTPVITADAPALTEVAGGAAVHVPAFDRDRLGEAMVELAHSPGRRAELSQNGLARARIFSWRRAALETLAVYRLAAGERRAVPGIRDQGSGIRGHGVGGRGQAPDHGFAVAPAEKPASTAPTAAARGAPTS